MEKDICLSITLILAVILNLLYSTGVIFVEQVFSLSHYVFPTSYDGYGPYFYEDFRPAEDILEFASLIAQNDTEQIISLIIFGNLIDGARAGILYWYLQTESLRSLFIVIWIGFLCCAFAHSVTGGIIGIITMLMFGIVLDLTRIVIYIIAWTGSWWFVMNPGNLSVASPQFIVMFVETLVSLGYVVVSLTLMGLIIWRISVIENSRKKVNVSIVGSRIGSKYTSKSRKKGKKKKKRRKGKTNKNFIYKIIPNKEL